MELRMFAGLFCLAWSSSAQRCSQGSTGLQMLQRKQSVDQLIASADRLRSLHSDELFKALAPPVVQQLRANVSEDGSTAFVEFVHEGLQSYKLTASSVYAKDAVALAETTAGLKNLSVSNRRTFTSRGRGSWASAVLHGGSSVSGLFQVGDQLVHVQPQKGASMLQTASSAKESPYDMAVDDHWKVPDVPEDQLPIEGAMEMHAMEVTDQWGGTPWFPGCYSGDGELHDFVMGAVADVDAWEEHGDSLQAKIEQVIAEASFVYERQFNVRLLLGYIKIYQSTTSAPAYAVGCDSLTTKLNQLQADTSHPFQGALHLFTGCGNGFGTVGVAWVGGMCDTRGYNTGVNQLHDSMSQAWLTFAHELGHNFNGQHSFEEGQGSTGGIMDYGDGLLNGVYQFNTEYRKDEMCQRMSSEVNGCNEKFVLATSEAGPSTTSEAGPSTSTMTTTTTTTILAEGVRVTQSGCACKQTWQLNGFAEVCRDYCCNPDSDANGEWCFVEDTDCQGVDWGYCAPSQTTSTTTSPQTTTTTTVPQTTTTTTSPQTTSTTTSPQTTSTTTVPQTTTTTTSPQTTSTTTSPQTTTTTTSPQTTTASPTFQPVDGGMDRACRGSWAGDNSADYFTVVPGIGSVAACQSACLDEPDCKGVEYSNGRCEVWTRDIQASVYLSGFQCWRRLGSSFSTTAPPSDFEPVNGGTDRVCRGSSPTDNSNSYFTVFSGESLSTCQARCRDIAACQGIEYRRGGRCEVWTRAAGIEATAVATGFSCYRYLKAPTTSPVASSDFQPVNGGTDRACRGSSPADNSPSHYTVVSGESLSSCQARCVAVAACKGIEYRPDGRCEVWTRPGGIQATVTASGYSCYHYVAGAATSMTTSTIPSTTTTTTFTTTTTTTSTSTITTTALEGRVTERGCACRQSWRLSGTPEDCTTYCCNPDSDPNGDWCFVVDDACEGRSWGYCSEDGAVTTTTTTTAGSSSAGEVSGVAWQHFQLVNDLRAAGFSCPQGQSFAPNPTPLLFDCRLWKASQLHSQDMADNNYFDHSSQDGRSPWDRAEAQGISANAENIAAGRSGAQETLDQWKGSDGHCRNMMNPDNKLFAVGYGYNSASTYRHYWTQMFKRQEVSLDKSCYPSSPMVIDALHSAEVESLSADLGSEWQSDKSEEASAR